MASADAMAHSEMTRAKQEILRLKRDLVSDDFQGHSCELCEHIAIREEGKTIFRLDATPAEIYGLAASGCNFWIMIRNRLASIARDDEINVAQSSEEREWRWTDDQYKILAASSAEDEMDAYVHLGSSFEWSTLRTSRRDNSLGMPVNHVRATVEYWGIFLNEVEAIITSRWLHHRLAPINLNPDSSTSMELYRHWMKQGELDHECGIRDLPESMPSLILDVAGINGIKLIQVPAKLKESYVALSYCWGLDRQRTMLTRSNQPELLVGIELDALDLTISDSITVTRELGFRYLWIDALCIVQDDREFKAQELEKMGDIYRNAAFTIIASGAKDVTEGFLHRRTSNLDRVGVIPGYTQPVFKFQDEAAQTPVVLVPYKDYGEEPWYQRAWTLQEMLFSKRRLQFGLTQTTWVCCGHGGRTHECDGWRLDSSLRNRFHLPLVMMVDRSTQGEILTIWFDLIRQYSSRQLRYRRDRLPAISAIARDVSSILGNYSCGLWTSHLPMCLTWYRKPGNMSGSKVGPSWSWASHEGEVEWGEYEGSYDHKIPNQDFMLLSHNSDLVTPGDLFGEVKRAELHVRGLLLPIRGVKRDKHVLSRVKFADETVFVDFRLDYRDIPGEQPDDHCKLGFLVLADWNNLAGAEGIILLEEAENRYSRVGWFHLTFPVTRTSMNEDGKRYEIKVKSVVEEDDLGRRLRQLGGGEEAIREVVLI